VITGVFTVIMRLEFTISIFIYTCKQVAYLAILYFI